MENQREDLFGGRLLSTVAAVDMHCSGEWQSLCPQRGHYASADPSVYSPYSPTYAAADPGASLAFDPAESSLTSSAAGVSPLPCSWDPSAPLLAPAEAVSVIGQHQDPFLPGPFSLLSDGRSYDPGTAEMTALEDISTWDLDEIKRVATSLEASIMGDQTEDFASPFMREEGPRAQAAETGCSLSPWQELSPDAGGAAHQAAPVGLKGGYQRKQKMYNLGLQADPEMEKRRKDAIKQRKKRVKDKNRERDLESTFKLRTQQVARLRQEMEKNQCNISTLQALLAYHAGQPTQHQHGK